MHRASSAAQDHQDPRETKVNQDPLALQVQMGNQEQMVALAQKVTKENKVQLVFLAVQVNLDKLVHVAREVCELYIKL